MKPSDSVFNEAFFLELRQLIAVTCSHPPGSLERQKGLTQLIRMIQKSGKLLKDSTLDYEDALQQTWIYLCRNLCEATTGSQYDPHQANVITWINAYLKRRLQDQKIALWEHQKQTVSLPLDSTHNPLENLAKSTDSTSILPEIQEWVKQDPGGILKKTFIRDRPDLNCQLLILRRLPPETSWEALAAEFKISSKTLSSFYSRQCLPRLREFGKQQGYL